MTTSRILRGWAALTALVALSCAAGLSVARADAYLKQIRTTEASEVMGQQVPASTQTSELWFSDKAARMDSGDGNSVILSAEGNVVYMLDHQAKTYTEIPLDQAGLMAAMTPEGASDEDAEAAEMMKQMVASMMANTQVTVTPTEERKKFREWSARKYLVEIKMPMGTANSEVWASPEVRIDMRLFQKLSMAMSGMMTDVDKMLKEMEKIDGMEVFNSTVAEIMGSKVKTTSELIEYAQKPAPAGAYALPQGYTKTKLGH